MILKIKVEVPTPTIEQFQAAAPGLNVLINETTAWYEVYHHMGDGKHKAYVGGIMKHNEKIDPLARYQKYFTEAMGYIIRRLAEHSQQEPIRVWEQIINA